MKLHIFMHSLHGKSLPLIFLIIIPLFFYTFFTFFFAYVLSFYFGVVGNYELYLNVRDYATYTLFVLLFLVYGLYPYKLS